MIPLFLILKQESLLGIIRSLKFKNIFKKLQEDMNHYLRLYFGCYAQENSQVREINSKLLANNEFEDL